MNKFITKGKSSSDPVKILIFSGGRGSASLYIGIKNFLRSKLVNAEIFLLANAYDDGLSTGEVRKFIPGEILGPSDIRKLQERQYNYLYKNESISKFFSFRFHDNSLQARTELINIATQSLSSLDLLSWFEDLPPKLQKISYDALSFINLNYGLKKIDLTDFAFSNLIYAGMAGIHNNDLQRVEEIIFKVLKLEDRVLLNSSENKYLYALTEGGELLLDEASIVDYKGSSKIYEVYMSNKKLSFDIRNNFLSQKSFKEKKLFCENISSPYPKISRLAKAALKNSDIIIFSPGTQYSSLYPTYLTVGLSEVLSESNAHKIFISNISPDNESHDMTAADFISQALFYLNRKNQLSFPSNELISSAFVNDPGQKLDTNLVKVDMKSLAVFNFYDVFISQKFMKKSNDGLSKHSDKFLANSIYSKSKKFLSSQNQKFLKLNSGLLSFDIDGTLFSDRRVLLIKGKKGNSLHVDKVNLGLLCELLQRGIKLLIISGNDISTIRQNFINPLMDLMDNHPVLENISIFANGATSLYKYHVQNNDFKQDSNYQDLHVIQGSDRRVLLGILRKLLRKYHNARIDDKDFFNIYDKKVWNYKKRDAKIFLREGNSQIVLKPIPSSKHFCSSYYGFSYRAQMHHDLIQEIKKNKLSKDYEAFKRGWGTIEIQRKGITKSSAINYYLSNNNISDKDILYFGNEFEDDGNDSSLLDRGIPIIGISSERHFSSLKNNIFYGGSRGVASTSYHLNALLELHETLTNIIKKDPRIKIKSISSLYVQKLREEKILDSIKEKIDINKLSKSIL